MLYRSAFGTSTEISGRGGGVVRTDSVECTDGRQD